MTWLVLNSAERGSLVGDAMAPTFVSAEVGLVDNNTVVLTFSEFVESPTADYKTGFTVKVDAVTETISTGTLGGGMQTIQLAMVNFIYRGCVVTVEYDAVPGNIQDISANAMASFGAQSVTNNAGGGLLWDKAATSMWWALM